MSRRTQHLLRDFVDLVAAAIERGDMTIERAAELMLEHRVPSHVAARIIARAQQPCPVLHEKEPS